MATATKQPKEERLDLRITGDLKRTLENAAALVGQSLSAFILGLVVPQARKVIQDANVIELSERDTARFLAALDDEEAKPNGAMRRAVDRYKSSVA